MKKYIGTVLLLAAGLMIASPMALAADALSAVLPAPWENRVGSQLVYIYEDGAAGTRGTYKAFLTATNTSITATVWVHVQVYTLACQEVFDFVDKYTPADQHVYDPVLFKKNSGGATVGSATNGRFIVTITAIAGTNTISDRRAIANNNLSGQLWQAHVGQEAAFAVNAVSRLAVSPSGAVAAAGSVLDGTTFLLQQIQPVILLVNSFFAPDSLQQPATGIPAGNRLSLVNFIDDYVEPDQTYRIKSDTAGLTTLLFNHKEDVFSIPPDNITCWEDKSIGFNSGGFTNFLGAAVTPSVAATGGWVRMRPSSHGNVLFGIFSQSLGKYGGGMYLVGIGRLGSSTYPMLTNWNITTGVATYNTVGGGS